MKKLDYSGFYECASEFLQGRIFRDYLHCFGFGIDASCYAYTPKIVIKAYSEEEIIKLFKLSARFNIPLCFRAAGTSLSGQASSESVLVIANTSWQDIQISNNATSISLQCGVIGQEANNALKKFGKKIGPDPATINNAMIGGIFNNNSSGMCCGVAQNSYNTIKSIRVILADGFILDTSDESSLKSFCQTHKDIVDSLLALREQILNDEELKKLINKKFAIKNTTGYSINALLDFSDIKDILNHIFIGSEGTLGFVSKVEYFCVEDFKHKASALLFYENLDLAASAVKILASNKKIVSAAEIMDYECLKASAKLESAPKELKNIKPNTCAILVQVESNNLEELNKNIKELQTHLKAAPSLFGENFSFDLKIQQSWWNIRKGLLPISASTRPSGSTVITEDICFDIENFAKGMQEITKLFKQYDFKGIIFGHALSGNVHFIITPILSDENQKLRFANFMDSMVNMVVKLNGSTKAEHGTGRMMAPFVEIEWGKKAYKINVAIKDIFDKKRLINPDVIICENKQIHLQNLKPANALSGIVGDFIDKCMECGFCEKVCPSKDITLSPRQRIAVFREIERLKAIESKSKEQLSQLQQLEQGYIYNGITTCATCSMCQSLCPLEIDTAHIANTLKPQLQSRFSKKIANSLQNNIKPTLKALKSAIGAANAIQKLAGEKQSLKISKQMNKAFKTPIIPSFMPTKNTYELKNRIMLSETSSVIYFTSCLNRTFAPSHKANDKRALQEVFESICAKAKINVIYPLNLDSICCGKAFKDYPKNAKNLKEKLKNALDSTLKMHNLSTQTIIVCDHSACSYEAIKSLKNYNLLDLPDFLHSILDKLNITKLDKNIAIYAMCAVKKAGAESKLLDIAKACVNGKIITHNDTYCCGFAGNKGFFTPELNDSALQKFSKFFAKQEADCGFGSSSTCEIGLSEKSGFSWQHIAYLLDSCSK